MIANTTVRIAYVRTYGFVSQRYWWAYQEDEANRSDTRIPLWGSLSAFTNYMVDFLRKRGINTVLVRPSGSLKIGTPNENGTYDGLIGLLQNNEADFSSFPIAQDLPFDPIEYTDYIAESKSVILESALMSNGAEYFVDFFVQLLQIYSLDIWIIFMNIMCIIVSILYFVSRWQKISRKRKLNVKIKPMVSYIGSTLWQLIRIPINQPDIQCKKHKERIVMLSFLIMVIFSNIMALNLLGTKMVVREDEIVKSFHELLLKPEYDVHWLSNTYMLAKFVNSNDPDSMFSKIYKKFMKTDSVIALKDGYKDMPNVVEELFSKSKTVLIDEEYSMSAISLFMCSLAAKDVQFHKTVVEGSIIRFSNAYNSRIDPQLKHWLQKASKRTLEAGFAGNMIKLGLLYDPSLARQLHCFDHETEYPHRPIAIADIIVLKHIAVAFVIVAFLCLCCECTKLHGSLEILRRYAQKLRLRNRVLMLQLIDESSFGFKNRYRRRTIRVSPIGVKSQIKWYS